MIAVEAPRSLDDLVLSLEGEEARQAAADAIVDGIPVDLDPLPIEEPEPEPPSAEEVRRRASHERAMLRAFPARSPQMRGLRRARRESGKWAPKYPDWIAEVWGGEQEADLRGYPLPYAPDPDVGDGEIVWGASLTLLPVEDFDPDCAFEAREVEAVAPTSPVAEDVAAWMEAFYEPMTVGDLVDLTGHSSNAVRAALAALREAGLVARQDVAAVYRDGQSWPSRQLWIWRRLP